MSPYRRLQRAGASLCAPVLAIGLSSLVLHGHAQAQVVERHQPETPQGNTAELAPPNALPTDQDATPIGPALRAVVILGAGEAVHAHPADGVTVGDVARLTAQQGSVEAMLHPFLGQPVSRQLIARVEAALARRYRRLNHPFGDRFAHR